MLTIRSLRNPQKTWTYSYLPSGDIECVLRYDGAPIHDYVISDTSMSKLRAEVVSFREEITHDDGEH